ncbi:MAG: Spx/MgsR family RNA polymerase-binding regulatory protein [Planctomycetes bacterium]|nr:Spx/MgsR family RNA polymerase-binding regulatory protein [Planctomycetota bacterium]
MSGIILYGKESCGTCKKVRRYLTDRGIIFETRDISTQPPPRDLLERVIAEADLKHFLNTRSATYREKGLAQNLPPKEEAIRMMLEDTNLIKRPVLVSANGVAFGYDPKGIQRVIA